MTSQRYPKGWADGSQVRGDASPSDYAWIVNFNNGNSDYNNRDNNNRVRAVRGVPREFQGAEPPASLKDLHAAWKRARRSKVPSRNQLDFDARWADNLMALQESLSAGTWSPRPSACFVALRPKAREIHAPDFADRVVHHWVVPQLEAIYEPSFIHDSFANRKGKGSHAAVRRLQSFVRQVDSGQGGGWFLQLDIANFFNCIHRPTLYRLLKDRCQRAGLAEPAMRVVHALLRHAPQHAGIRQYATPAERAQVPHHKRLENAAPGCGIPIGNLSSQFFANVYLNELDQFVKHTLRAKRYVRYVDDFVLVHTDRDQLEDWRQQIERFLGERLQLKLKAEQRLQPLRDGVDFLGYVIRPSYTLVRQRVVGHAREALCEWQRRHVRGSRLIAAPDDLRRIGCIWASYLGHLRHASSARLAQSLHRQFPWLGTAVRKRRFHWKAEGADLAIMINGAP